jgi:hypothetical protein
MQRNAMIVAANLGLRAALDRIRFFLDSGDECLCETARWAIQRLEQTEDGNL